MEVTHNLIDWIALSLITGVGSRTAANLLDKFGSPAACFNASITALEFAGIKREIIDQLKSIEPRLRAEEVLKKVEELGGSVLTLGDESYPSLLREMYDPPVVLYFKGNAEAALRRPTLAIVGSEDNQMLHDIAELIVDQNPNAQRVVIADAGHHPNMEHPELFDRTALSFLSTL